jgi:DNA-binding NarL/FixJ family response regulator
VDDSTTVLIVEDHAVLSEALTVRMERQPDISVVGSTASSAQVIPLIASRRPDVVVLDLELGTDNGADLVPEIRAHPSAPAIVILTSRCDTETAVSAFRQGASAYVRKDAPIEDLLVAIRTVAGGELWLSTSMLSEILPEILPSPAKSRAEDRLPLLTDREREVLTLMVDGLPNAAIAEKLHLSVHTVRTHAYNLQTKLNVHSKLAAVAFAHQAGIRPA